jgi:energy coupling factor transporter S component ThiW
LNLIRVIPAEEKKMKHSGLSIGRVRKLSIFLATQSKESEVTRSTSTRKIALAVVLMTLGVVLGSLSIPIGVTKVAPAQHMINAVAGVLLGPWYAVVMGLITATIRIGLGVGTVYAYPGSVFGGLVVGLVYRYVKRTDYAALLEPLGTVVIGASLSALVVSPLMGGTATLAFFWTAFAASCIPGSILGFIVLKAVRRVGYDRYFV